MAQFPIFGTKKMRMKPLMIVIAAVALGLIFLGIVLTIVGHWPGYTSWGSNPLKYLGPALLGVGIIAMIGVVAFCCVMAEKDDSDYDQEKKEFVDISSPQSGENTPSVVVRGPYETSVKQAPPNSAFRPYTGDNGLNHDVNVLKILKDSPTREKKYSSNYNTGNSAKIPTPSYPSDTNGKKTVGYNSYAYSSDGDKMKVAEEQKLKSKAPYIQPADKFIPPEGPRKWGSAEKILESSGGSKTPPRSPKSKKSTGDPSQGIFLERAPRNNRETGRLPALHMPVVGRRSKGKYRQGSSEPSSPVKTTKPEQEEPDLEIKRTLIVANKEGKEQGAKWGTHSKNKETGLSPVNGEGMSKDMQAPSESTPRDQANSSREYDRSRDYSKQYSDPQGHTSRRERERQSRSRQHGSRSRDRDGRRDRSSSGHRRHRSRSRDRDSRGRTRDDVYSATSIDYVTGAPIRRSGRSKSQERDPSRYGSTGSRRSRSHDRGLNKSYDSDEMYRRHRHPHDYYSRDPCRTGVVNTAYDRDASSDDSHGLSPRHRPHHLNHSNSTGASADEFMRSGQLTLSPNNKKQTMHFTINVNAQPGSAVQIAMGNQPLPPAKPMLPANTSINLTGVHQTSDMMMTQLPHDSSIESSSSRTRPVRT